MNKEEIKSKFGKHFKNNKNMISKRLLNIKRKNISKSLLFLEMILLLNIKINIVFSQLTSIRNIIYKSSSIKLKIKNSGNQKIYYDGNFRYCRPVIIPDQISINGKSQKEIKNRYSFEHVINEVTLTWHNPLEYTTCMFRECSSITEIDLSNFDDSNLKQMSYMFSLCSSLEKIEIYNIKANKVTDSGLLFDGCSKLKSIDLANFNAPKNNYQHYMFRNCGSLLTLNFPNFNVKNSQITEYIFQNCNKLKNINFENAIIDNGASLESNLFNSGQIICTHSPKLLSIIKNVGATLNCQNDYCISQTGGDDCFSLGYKYQYKNIYYKNCPSGGIYIDNYNCIDCDEKCSSCSKESTDKNLCLSCNNIKNYYKKYDNSQNGDSPFMECLKSPKGFYFDAINSVYKPCYQSCASCNIDGNEQNHNCNECSDQYNFELNLNDYLNCYFKCPNYYYEEKNNNNIKYKCTKAKECPEEYNKLIPDIGKCIDKCEKENIYKYEYGNECLDDCPERTVKNKNEIDNTFYCNPICDEEAPFEIIKEQ